MIIQLTFVNPLSNELDVLKFEEFELDYINWRIIEDTKTDEDVCRILDKELHSIDCTRMLYTMRVITLNSYSYTYNLGVYYYYLIKIKNQILYNKYLDILLNRHKLNIIFESNYKAPTNKPDKQKTKKTKKLKDEYRRYETKDMFTEETIYVYVNDKTKDEIKSTNPNLLEELNKKKVKSKTKIDLSMMTFSFKIK